MRTSVKITAGMLGTALSAGAMATGLLATSGFTPAHATVTGTTQARAAVTSTTQARAAVTSTTRAARAGGTVSETVSQVNRIISAKCYRETRVEIGYYRHSRTLGWVRLPAPAKTVSITTHCYK